MAEVTFIIPTLGRPTLERTIYSLSQQTIPTWKAFVIWDGVSIDKIIEHKDKRVSNIPLENKLGHAGLVRNVAFPYITTEWMAFVDDDDWLDPHYIEAMDSYLESRPDLDVIIFTYHDRVNRNIQPPLGTTDFVACSVGISFAVRTNFVLNNLISFTEGGVEDFRFLDDCRNKGAKYLVTNDIKYYVGGRGGWR